MFNGFINPSRAHESEGDISWSEDDVKHLKEEYGGSGNLTGLGD